MAAAAAAVDSQSMDINLQVRKFTWKMENFSSLQDKKLYSNSFTVGGIRWRLLIFPKGNGVDHFSIYLDVADSQTLAHGWSIYALIRFTVVDQINRQNSITRVTKHEFNDIENEWGFTSFLALSELHDPKRGYLVNDACLVEAFLCTDRTINLESLELIVKSKEANCGKAAIDNQKTLVTNPEEIATPSQSEDPTEEDMDAFFTSLESELASFNTVSPQEEAKEALAKIEEALNMAPANFHDSGEFSALNQAFKILSSFDCSYTLTTEQKNELLAMEENFKQLSERAAKAVQDRNFLVEKESLKLTLTRNLEHNLIKFKETKGEVKQIEQKIAALHHQVGEAQKHRENMLPEGKHIFRISNELKEELEALVRQWPEYEAKAEVAQEEEKTVEAEWGKMRDFISSLKGKI